LSYSLILIVNFRHHLFVVVLDWTTALFEWWGFGSRHRKEGRRGGDGVIHRKTWETNDVKVETCKPW